MPRYEYQAADGGLYEIEAPDDRSVMSIIANLHGQQSPEARGAVVGPAPDNTPIPKGDWNTLSLRLANAEAQAVGPTRPQDREAIRQMEARRQGQLYGAAEGGGRNVEVGINAFANTAGLGLPQLMEAYLGQSVVPGADAHEFIKAADDARYKQNASGALAGQIGGAAAQAFMLPYNAVTAPRRVAQAAGAGAALNAGEGAIRSRGDTGEIARDALTGGAFGLAGGAIGEGIGAATQGVFRAIKNNQILRNAPTEAALDVAKRSAYDAANAEGLAFKPQALERLTQDATAAVRKYGEPSIVAPQATRVLGLLDDAAKTSKTLDYVEGNIRSTAQNAASALSEGKDYAANRAIVGAIDDFYKNVKPSDLWGGNSQKAIGAVQDARKAAAAQFKMNDLNEALRRAELNAASSGSGSNLDNTTRQAFKTLALNPDNLRGYSKAEIEQLNRTIEGGSLQNTLRFLGKFSPTGVVGTAGTLGSSYAVGDMAGLTPQEKAILIGGVMAGGVVSRKMAEAIGRRNVEVLKGMVTTRGIGKPVADPAELSKAVEALRRVIATSATAAAPTYLAGAR